MPRGYYNTEQEKQFDMFHLTEKCQFMLEAGIINNLSATKNVLQIGKKKWIGAVALHGLFIFLLPRYYAMK